jgi:hypothetical protein
MFHTIIHRHLRVGMDTLYNLLEFFGSGDEGCYKQKEQQHVQQTLPLFQHFHCRPHPGCFRRPAHQFVPVSGLLIERTFIETS